jgi:hypothetical protein
MAESILASFQKRDTSTPRTHCWRNGLAIDAGDGLISAPLPMALDAGLVIE